MDITVQELKERLENGEKMNFYDVREEHEYEEDNLGATLIPLGSLPEELEDLKAKKDEEIIVHCRSGARSANAQKYLVSHGFSDVRNVTGGILAYRRLEEEED